MRPVFAIDMDSVICNNEPTWIEYFKQNVCGTHAPGWESGIPTRGWYFYQDLCKRCWGKALHDRDLLMQVAPKEGALSGLKFLSKRADLYLVTSRSPSVRNETEDWLFWHGFHSLFKQIILTKTKRPVCEAIGAVSLLDDAEKNILDLEGSSVHPIIMDAYYNRSLSGIRVTNWLDAVIVMLGLATKAGFNVSDETLRTRTLPAANSGAADRQSLATV